MLPGVTCSPARTCGARLAIPCQQAHAQATAAVPCCSAVQVTQQNLLGTAITLAGVFAYSQVKRSAGKPKAA